MDFWQAVRSVFAKYAAFRGRAPRSEFWFWILFMTLVGISAAILDGAIDFLIGTTGER